MDGREFELRKAPYAPVSALTEFFDRIRGIGAPSRVDRRFLERLNVASGNEWALLSALKFLGVIDDNGVPTAAYPALQTTDRFQSTLRELVEQGYKPLLEAGGRTMTMEDLRNYFRVTSSASQAKNAARFFRQVCDMAGLDGEAQSPPPAYRPPISENMNRVVVESSRTSSDLRDVVLRAKAQLLEKLPAPHPDWSAEEYKAICDRFLHMLEHLDFDR